MSTLEARIAEVLAAHNPEAHYYIDGGGEGHMECRGCDGKWASFHGFYAHQAAMLAPLIREREIDVWDECDNAWTAAHKMSNYDPWEFLPDGNPYRADNLEAS